MRLFLLLLFISSTSSGSMPPTSWKCRRNIPGGIDGPYNIFMESPCANLQGEISQCCDNFNKCTTGDCVDDHEKCNANSIRGREMECAKIVTRFVQRENRPLPHWPPETWKCGGSSLSGGTDGPYFEFMKSLCADLHKDISQCCDNFKNCKGKSCVDDHENCNANSIRGRERECAKIVTHFVQRENRELPRIPPETWKCRKPNLPGGTDGPYFKFMKSLCADLQNSINQCCIDFNSCQGSSCVDKHKTCNKYAIFGRERQCSAIADLFVQKDDPFPPTKDFACESRGMGGALAVQLRLIKGICKDLTDPLSDCCAVFNKCDKENGLFCVEDHEKCNYAIVSGREQECINEAGKLIRNDRRRFPDKDWKCKATKNLPGALEQSYRNVVSGICFDLKDKLNQCCVNYDVCSKNNGDGCISQHEKCNAGVISGREGDCSTIADSLVFKEPSHPDKRWSCHSKFKGGAIAVYRSLLDGVCKDLTDPLSDCCAAFNKCDKDNGFGCVEDHEKCNYLIVSGREQECINYAGRLIRNDRRRFPDKDWKCRSNSNLLGAWEQDYRDLVGGTCDNLKDRLNQCCVNFDVCIKNTGDGCVSQHEKCNAEVISGREKDCSTIADRFIQRDKPGPKPDPPKPRGQIIIYFETVIVYAQEQMETHPHRFWMGIALIILATFLLLCGTCFLCCSVLGKRREEARKNEHSSSRASSVKSDSGRN